MTKATIYHNPKCSKSRDALRFLSDSGIEATIVLYLEAGWTAELLQELKGSSGLDWKHMLRPDAQSDLEDALAENDSGTIVQY
ncbi:MAG: arsenate reductase (glutaredoxin), partial [Gammaproteobacteria bacterium]|nr:arsenate reductase (glutaredoxin) [Gammaproteobacteria bacterium]